MKELERLKNNYNEMKDKIETLDEDLIIEYKEEFEYWNNYHNEHVKFIVIINNITKYICIQKFRHCKKQCRASQENVFHCEFCKNIG